MEETRMADEDKLCCVFIDNSNLFIEGQKSYAKQQKFRVDIDTRFRIDYGKLMNVLVGKRELVYAALYGSEPPPTDNLWERIREKNIEVFRYKRDDKNCEKELDTSLTAHVTRKAMEMSQDYVGELTRLTFIIVAGDGDYISAFKQVIQENLKLEVWAWKSSLAGRIKECKKEHDDKMSVHYLDGDDEKTDEKTGEKSDEKPPCRPIHFINYRWDPGNHEFPRERSIVIHHSVVTPVITGSHSTDHITPVMLTTEITNLIKFPCKYLKLDHMTVIVIVLSDKFRVTESILEKCKDVLSLKSPDNTEVKVSDYPTYAESCHGEIVKYGLAEHKVAKPCIFKFACFHGSGCNYEHTEEEKKHFEKHPNRIGDKYKSKFCTNVKKSGKCRYKSCVYAHNLNEARCYICDPGGLVGDHWMYECANKIE